MEVRMVYQPYSVNMALYIDKQPIGLISTLAKYQTLPFSAWYDEILQAIEAEVNDQYDLTYSGREAEYQVLKTKLPKCRSCTSIRYEPSLIPDSAQVRLKKLSRLVLNGVECAKTVFPLYVYTDCGAESVTAAIKAILPKLSFCTFNVMTRSLSESGSPKDRDASIALLSSSCPSGQIEKTARFVGGMLCDRAAEAGSGAGTLILSAESVLDTASIQQLLELSYYPSVLSQSLKRTSVPENSPFYKEVMVLDKTEPQMIVKLPKSIEYDTVVPINVTTFPKSDRTPDIRVRVSNDTVIAYTPDGLKGVGTGVAVVEVYEAGKTVPVATSSITAFRTNRVKSISLNSTSLKMLVGESRNLDYSISPADADDRNKIRLVSEDGSTVAIQNGRMVGKRTGSADVYYEGERVSSEKCTVRVYPRLEKLESSEETVSAVEKELTRLSVRRVPSDAVLDKLTFIVDPPSLGSYDIGTESFFAREPGTGQITVVSDRSGIQTVIPVTVKRKSSIPVKPLLIAGGIIVLLLLWFLLH